MRNIMKLIVLSISIILILTGYYYHDALLLTIGLIITGKTILVISKFFSRNFIDFSTFAAIMISLVYGYVAGILFVLSVPILVLMALYFLFRKEADDMIPPTFQIFENFIAVLIAIIAPIIYPFFSFPIVVVLLSGMKISITIVRNFIKGEVPNLIGFSIFLIISFYLAQFLQGFVA